MTLSPFALRVSAGALLLSVCVCGCSFCSTLRYEVQPALRTASATGTLQVPRGGDPRSSSGNRPGLEEIGVGTTVQTGAAVRVRSGRAGLALDMRYLFLVGEGHAQSALVSQGVSFKAGSELESSPGRASRESRSTTSCPPSAIPTRTGRSRTSLPPSAAR